MIISVAGGVGQPTSSEDKLRMHQSACDKHLLRPIGGYMALDAIYTVTALADPRAKAEAEISRDRGHK